MTQAVFFPANNLGVTVCSIFNGHEAIVSANTDRLIDGKYAAAEMAAFKHNVQATAFLNPEGAASGENVGYGTTLRNVAETGRISFGLYYRTDRWVNPSTGASEPIPDYNASTWTAAGVASFSGAVLGAAKATRYPNHGQQMFDISGGAYGYDTATQAFGASGGSETLLHTQAQLNYFRMIAGLNISSASYANGRTEVGLLNLPFLLGTRNSSYSASGTGEISYSGLSRMDLMSRASTTRAWDAVNAGQFADQTASLAYMQSQIAAAISAGGWFSDFMHWHSLYSAGDVEFFDPFFAAIDGAIDTADVWRAGNNEANEYYVLRESIEKVGSFVDGAVVRIAYRFKDGFPGATDGISNALAAGLIDTPISLQIDLTGTPLAGQDIVCGQARSIRKLGADQWIVNLRPTLFGDGYFGASISAGAGEYYDAARPGLSYLSGIVSADRPCRWAVWRKPSGAPMADLALVKREHALSASLNLSSAAGHDYFVGAITPSRASAVLEVST